MEKSQKAKKKREEILPDPEDIQDHFSKLYKQQSDGENNNFRIDTGESEKTELMDEVTLDEIKFHIRKTKNKKSSGNDGISNEILKDSNEEMFKLYKSLFNKIIGKEKYPANLNISLTQLIHKEGSREDPSNFRGIALTSNLAKKF